jgi:tetratricopeptide (TPR) repeat protein
MDKVRKLLYKALEMEPKLALIHLWLGMFYIEQHSGFDKAIEHLQRAVELGSIFGLGWLGLAYALAGKKDSASKILNRLEDLSKERYISPFQKALVYLGLGKFNQAFEELEKAYSVREPYFVYLKLNPFPWILGEDPRYRELINKIGIS